MRDAFRHPLFKAGCAAVVLATAVTAWHALFRYEALKPVFLQVVMQTSVPDRAVLYYDAGRGFREEDATGEMLPGDGRYHTHKFRLPRAPIHHLRLDPLSGPGTVAVREMAIVNARGKPIVPMLRERATPLQQLKALPPASFPGAVAFQAAAGADDPQLDLGLAGPVLFRWRTTYPAAFFLGSAFLEWLGLAVLFGALLFLPSRCKPPGRGIVVVALVLILAWRVSGLYEEGQATYLQVEMQSSVPGTAALYYDTGAGLSEKASSQARVRGGGDFRWYRFFVPPETIRHLRLDPPLSAPGRVRIREIRLADGFGTPLVRLGLDQLQPANQIADFRASKDQVSLAIAAEADDPQVDIRLPAPLALDKLRRFPVSGFVLQLALNAGALLVAGVLLVWGFPRWRPWLAHVLASSFFRKRWPILCMGCALGLALAMATVSGFDTHPDEKGHALAAQYYFTHWLPPAVDDPDVAASTSVFGVSYLFDLDLAYLLAGKAALALRSLVLEDHLGLRLFNVALFAFLMIRIARRVDSSPLAVFALLATPQVWYLFSYVNSDAYALFLSLLLAVELTDPHARGCRFLEHPAVFGKASGGVLLGVLAGLLLLSRVHYRLFLAFVACFACWQILFAQSRAQRALLAKKWLLVGLVAGSVYLPCYAYDQIIHDFQKQEKAGRVMERHAGEAFKPSALAKSPETTYKGLRLRDKGIAWQDMFVTNPEWRDLTVSSLLGLYGYMDLYSEKGYYGVMRALFLLALVVVVVYAAWGADLRDAVLAAGALAAVLATVGLSVYYSWNYDYQPQGRYLFPVIPMLLVGLSRLPEGFRTRFVPVFGTVCFVLGAWSFAFSALASIPKG